MYLKQDITSSYAWEFAVNFDELQGNLETEIFIV